MRAHGWVMVLAMAACGGGTQSSPQDAAAADFSTAAGDLSETMDAAASDLSTGPDMAFPPGTFAAPVTASLGEAPLAIAADDLDGDGYSDVVVTTGSDHFDVLLSNGDGTLKAAVAYASGSGAPGVPTDVALVDVNQDDNLDVVTAEGSFTGKPGAIAVSLGKGDGTFAAPTPFAHGSTVTSFTSSVVVTDVNGDAYPDVVTGDAQANGIGFSVFLGHGDGTFDAPVDYPPPSGANEGRHVAVADFNGDGYPDVVDAAESGAFAFYPGSAMGTFGTSIPTTLASNPSAPTWLAADDLDNDGNPDVVALDSTKNQALTLLGKGSGDFAVPTTSSPGTRPMTVVIADFDGDGSLDLAIADAGQDSVALLLGKGDGTFGTPTQLTTGKQPIQVVAADFNGDGTLDLATANGGDKSVSILLGH